MFPVIEYYHHLVREVVEVIVPVHMECHWPVQNVLKTALIRHFYEICNKVINNIRQSFSSF